MLIIGDSGNSSGVIGKDKDSLQRQNERLPMCNENWCPASIGADSGTDALGHVQRK